MGPYAVLRYVSYTAVGKTPNLALFWSVSRGFNGVHTTNSGNGKPKSNQPKSYQDPSCTQKPIPGTLYHIYQAYLVLSTAHVPPLLASYRKFRHIEISHQKCFGLHPPSPRFGIPIVFVQTPNKTFQVSNVKIVSSTLFFAHQVASHSILIRYPTLTEIVPSTCKFFSSLSINMYQEPPQLKFLK